MRKGGGKSKGASFERQISKDLSLWVSNGKNQDVFWRSAMSGGRTTVAMKKGNKLSAQAGDLSSIHRLGHSLIDVFVIECKAYKSLNFESMIKGKGHLLDFWKKVREEAVTHDKLPMLVGKQNNHPIIACLCREGIKRLSFTGFIKVKVIDHNLNIILWDDFLKRDPRVLDTKRKRIRL